MVHTARRDMPTQNYDDDYSQDYNDVGSQHNDDYTQ